MVLVIGIGLRIKLKGKKIDIYFKKVDEIN